MESFEPDFAEDRVHHDEQADCNGDGDSDECSALEGGACGGDEVREDYSQSHGEDYPDYEEAV